MPVYKVGKFIVSIDRLPFQNWRSYGQYIPTFKKVREKIDRITRFDLAVFFGQFAVLYNAGIHIVRILHILAEQTSNKRLAYAIREVKMEIEKGDTISNSFAKHDDIFNYVELCVLRVGEVVGDLAKMLNKLSDFEKRELEITKKVQSALSYPTMVFVFSIVLVFVLTQYLFKTYIPILKSQGVELNYITNFLIFVTSLFSNPFFLVSIFFLAFFLWYNSEKIIMTPALKEIGDSYLWRLPVFGATLKKMTITRFCFNISLLHESGLSIFRVLKIASESCGNALIEKAVVKAMEHMSQGETIWMSLKKCDIFPSSFIQMVQVGESSGTLSECLRKLADLYEVEVDTAVQSSVAALEPIMILVIGIFVGFVVLIAISPLYKLISTFSI